MSFFGIGKKKLDEQSREEQSAETAKAQKEQASDCLLYTSPSPRDS